MAASMTAPTTAIAIGTAADPAPTISPTRSHVSSATVRIVLGSDERTALTDAVAADLAARGAEVVLVGPPAGDDLGWTAVGRRVGQAVAAGDVDTGVLFCWTGTGASIAANKVSGVRAALCTDAATAAGARRWNDANVLVMSLRLTTAEVAHEMLDAWFATDADPGEAANIAALEDGD
jgi:ribose 5-phosphate isomerase B